MKQKRYMQSIGMLMIMIFNVHGAEKQSPYISGDLFRNACDFSVEGYTLSFEPRKVQYGDTVFVCGDLLDFFFAYVHPAIRCNYILVTHNSHNLAPDKFKDYLEDPKIIAWFGQNYDGSGHQKFFPLPTGIPNNYWPWIDTACIDAERKIAAISDRPIILYLNFVHMTPEREKIKALFKDKQFCLSTSRKPYKDYIDDMAHAQFVLCPSSKELDSHRTWEALLVGAIPIIMSSPLDILFHDLPVIIIHDWNSITEEFLSEAYQSMAHKQYDYERMFAAYWLDKIGAIKKTAKELLIMMRTMMHANDE